MSGCRSWRSSRSSPSSCSAPSGCRTWPSRPASCCASCATLANSARDELRNELGPEYADLELRDLDPRTIVRKHIIEAMDEDEGPTGRARRRGRRGSVRSSDGEVPPYDVDAT